MNLPLFVTQLNQLLQTVGNDEALKEVCGLLRMHTSSVVCVEDKNGRPLVEIIDESHFESKSLIELPIISGDTCLGRLILRRGLPFTEDENLAAGVVCCVCTVLMRRREGDSAAEKKRRAGAVRAIINTLSFSELEASAHIIKALGGNEGLLVAGHIADKLGFTRSVVTGALKKLEGTGLIETRSLGMKGTYIRFNDTLLVEELKKL